MKPHIPFSSFLELDLRVGEVVTAERVEGSVKLLKLTVDMGEEHKMVTILTGMVEYYAPEEFINKKYVFVANLEPRKMMGLESQGMLLSVDGTDRPTPLEVSREMANGHIVR